MSSAAPTAAEVAKRYVTVPTSILYTLDETQVDLFLQHNDEPQVLYRHAGYPLSRDRAQGIAQKFDDRLFVRAQDLSKFRNDLSGAMERVMEDEELQKQEKFEILQFAVSVEVEQSMRMVSCDQYLAKSQEIGQQIASLLDAGDVLPSDLFDIVRHDFHTFVHVTNVAGYAVLLARELGIRSRKELEQIAIGGLLHDIGKRHIPTSILNKTETLDNGDWEVIRQHPQRGYEELCRRDDLSHGQLMMTYQHHEHVDGNGYPVGITGEEIHDWAKLLAVVDVFDALTGQRPYRFPASKEKALAILEDNSGTQFEKECVRCWVSTMQQ